MNDHSSIMDTKIFSLEASSLRKGPLLLDSELEEPFPRKKSIFRAKNFFVCVT